MLQVILKEDHKLGQVEVQVHHILKLLSMSLLHFTFNTFMLIAKYFTDACLLLFFKVMVPLMLEEEHHQLEVGEVEAEGDHQLEGGEEEEEEAEAGEEGLLLCSMCTTEHCL
jgi:hypothetical protein